MQNNHDVVLHFSDTHVNYYTAWYYVTNSDKLYLQSVRHPDVKMALHQKQVMLARPIVIKGKLKTLFV